MNVNFDAWKARWPIFKCMAPYPFEIQRLIVVVSMALHNFIRQEAIADAEFRHYDDDDEYASDDEDIEINNDTVNPAEIVKQQQQEMGVIRDGITDSIFRSRRNRLE